MDMEKAEIDSTKKTAKKDEKNKKKKKKMQLPHWVLYPAWFLCVFVVFGCAFMIVWYGMAFGNQKSLEWLGSVTVGLVNINFHSYSVTALIRNNTKTSRF